MEIMVSQIVNFKTFLGQICDKGEQVPVKNQHGFVNKTKLGKKLKEKGILQ